MRGKAHRYNELMVPLVNVLVEPLRVKRAMTPIKAKVLYNHTEDELSDDFHTRRKACQIIGH